MKKPRFLKFPEYPGGKAAFKRYVAENLVYPEDAIKNRIEGTVHLSVEVDDNGKVIDVHIEKGIGHGCDEEAVRLVSLMHYGSVHNRGVRLKTRRRMSINFRLTPKSSEAEKKEITITMQEIKIQYEYKSSKEKPGNVSEKTAINQNNTGYSYTLNLNR